MNKKLSMKRTGELILQPYFQYFIFLVIIFISFFLKFRSFGLYEDDYWCIGVPANSDFNEIMKILKENFLNLQYNMGRFIGFTVLFFLPWLTYQIGGLISVYVFGILLIWVNSILVYKILNFRFTSFISVLGTLVFILFPADTTKPLLIHTYQLQLSLFFSLAAFLFYFKNKYFLSYLLAFFSLITYENAFLAFIFIPLFKIAEWDKPFLKKLITHFLIIGSFLLFLFLIRKFSGEERISSLELIPTIKYLIGSLILGPLTVLFSFIHAAIETLKNIGKVWYGILVGIIIILPLLLGGLKKQFYESDANKQDFRLSKFTFKMNPDVLDSLKMSLAGIFMLIVGYLFAFTHYPPTILAGRSTSVHFGAYIGSIVLLSGLLNICFIKIKRKQNLKILVIFLSGYFSILIGFGNVIQNDFQLSWEKQKIFWNQIINKTNKIDNGDLILVSGKNIEETKYIFSFSWATPDILNLLYKFPSDWENPKLAIIGNHCSTIKKDSISKKLYIEPMYPWLFEGKEKYYFNEENLIYFELNSGEFIRKEGDFYIDDILISTTLSDSIGVEFTNLEKREIAKFFNLKK